MRHRSGAGARLPHNIDIAHEMMYGGRDGAGVSRAIFHGVDTMDERLTHDAELIGYKHSPNAARVTEIAVYADGMVKKLDRAVRGGFKEWRHEDPEKFLHFNRTIEKV